MTTNEEWLQIAENADAFMFEAYGADTAVSSKKIGEVTLRGMQAMELTIRNPEELLADPQLKRAGVWARMLDEAGLLRPEHRDLLPHADGYGRV